MSFGKGNRGCYLTRRQVSKWANELINLFKNLPTRDSIQENQKKYNLESLRRSK